MTGDISEVTPPESGNSFTALLGLPANQAMELLHEPESTESPAIEASEDTQKEQNLNYISNCSLPIFVSNSDLIERAARFSVFATTGEDISDPNLLFPSNSTELKKEQADSESNHSSSPIFSDSSVPKRSTKRKEREEKEKKVKITGIGKSKKVEINGDEDREKLPYVHVRARRGQATDSHSLAERARREKINARMKLLQELVPGCAKITGTASVLDEIINHVQSLQRQVEFLSMRLAAVNPRIDFSLESFLATQSGVLTATSFPSTITAESSLWPEFQISNNTIGGQQHNDQNQNQLLLQQQHQLFHLDMFQQPGWERDHSNQSLVTSPENSVYSSFNSTNTSVALHPNQLKMEI